MDKKYWYYVGTCCAEGNSDGWVHLTEKEAEVVSYVCNMSNWQNASFDNWSGSMWIDLKSKRETIE